MTRLSYLLGILAGLFFGDAVASKQFDPPRKNGKEKNKWVLIWEDNFDYKGLPSEKYWDYEEGYIRNHEAQYYTRGRLENARVENGHLIIEARKDDWNEKPITSASLNTYGKQSMLYGRIEVRAKLPTGVGTWPAIWMLGNSYREGTRWPDCGEIDIMENVGFDPNVIHAYVHTKAYNHAIGTAKGNKITTEKPWENFHVYAVEWYEDRLEFYFDDECYFVFENERKGSDVWPFDKPHYLILNLAIGGGWGGQKGIDDNIFPQKYYIDYVRVYRQKE
jgi:beta-glucanase (GH16 family)